MTDEQIPAGWYPDPLGDTTIVRYWDGAAWTAQTLNVLDLQNNYPLEYRQEQSVASAGNQAAANPSYQDVYWTPKADDLQLEQQDGQQTGQPQSYPQGNPGGYQQPYLPMGAEMDKSNIWLGIGIASIFLLTWIIAIPQIIFAWSAHTAFAQGNIEIYRKNLKTSRTLFVVNICLMAVLLPCIIMYFMNYI
jgi:hypothetical protein